MKARDVLAAVPDEAWFAGFLHEADPDVIVAALLAQVPPGEGVYIASGGTLMRAYAVNAYDPDRDDPDDYDRNVYRLVPIEGADRD